MSKKPKKNIKVSLRSLDRMTEKRFEKLQRLIDIANQNNMGMDIDLDEMRESHQRNHLLESEVIEAAVAQFAEKHKAQKELSEEEVQQRELEKIALIDEAVNKIQAAGSNSTKRQLLEQFVDKATEMGIGIAATVAMEKLLAS